MSAEARHSGDGQTWAPFALPPATPTAHPTAAAAHAPGCRPAPAPPAPRHGAGACGDRLAVHMHVNTMRGGTPTGGAVLLPSTVFHAAATQFSRTGDAMLAPLRCCAAGWLRALLLAAGLPSWTLCEASGAVAPAARLCVAAAMHAAGRQYRMRPCAFAKAPAVLARAKLCTAFCHVQVKFKGCSWWAGPHPVKAALRFRCSRCAVAEAACTCGQ